MKNIDAANQKAAGLTARGLGKVVYILKPTYLF